jgi:hypothetical protein
MRGALGRGRRRYRAAGRDPPQIADVRTEVGALGTRLSALESRVLTLAGEVGTLATRMTLFERLLSRLKGEAEDLDAYASDRVCER